jgi:adenylate cyclase
VADSLDTGASKTRFRPGFPRTFGLLHARLSRIAFIAVGWAIEMFILTQYEYSLLGSDGYYPNGIPYDYHRALWLTPLVAIVGGLILGTFEVFYLEKRLRRKPFGYSLLLRAMVYFVLLFLMVGIGVHIYGVALLGDGVLGAAAVRGTLAFVLSRYMVILIFVWSTALLAILFLLKISDKYGPGMLRDMLLGRYYNSCIENRIFMFLDINASTTIAEKLGHVRWFRLLNDFFSDITDSIVHSKGEIYQYVGDEVVVTWRPGRGASQANCLRCFFDIQQTIDSLAPRYEAQYGVVPGFKAGVHYGEVTAGEIGIIKKEIIFTGDVLNTTARIQGQCKEHGVNLLVSEDLGEILPADHHFTLTDMGRARLRGRESPIRLYAVAQKQ